MFATYLMAAGRVRRSFVAAAETDVGRVSAASTPETRSRGPCQRMRGQYGERSPRCAGSGSVPRAATLYAVLYRYRQIGTPGRHARPLWGGYGAYRQFTNRALSAA